MKISCSGRKPWEFHVSHWLDFMRAHAKIHSSFRFDYDDIDYVFGQTEEFSRLWGGRVAHSHNLTRLDTYWLYDKGIGVKLPLSTKIFDEDNYKESAFMLNTYHRDGNSILTGTHELARRVKNDFPDYKLEASAVMDINTEDKLNGAIATGLYDTIVLPIGMNDDTEFLERIENKDQIRLFINAECSYTCPNKVCYGTTSQINSERTTDEMKCSHYDYNMERTFYDDSVDWTNFYFKKAKFDEMGFSNYKLVPSWASQQRTNIMYKDPLSVQTKFALG